MKPRRTTGVIVAILVIATEGLGCQSLGDGAKDEFEKDFSCPEKRVEIRPRSDVAAYDLIFQKGGKSKPPADVAKDPARLAIWQKREDESRASWNSSESIFELRGCDHEGLYACSRSNTGRSSGRVMCSRHDYPAGVARW